MSIGQVLSRAFGMMGSNPVIVFGTILIFVAMPQVVGTYALIGAAEPENLSSFSMIFPVYMIVAFVLSSIAQGVLTKAAVASSDGMKIGILDCLRPALSKLLPVIGAAILAILGSGLGMLLLLVPGIILVLMWSVAVPAIVNEDLGPIEGLGRSRALTSGSKWKIFALYLVAGVIYLVIAMLFGLLISSISNSQFGFIGVALNLIGTTLSIAIMVTIPPALYIELREAKEGPVTEALAQIFE